MSSVAIGAVLLLMGLALPFALVRSSVARARFRRRALQATGTVVRQEEERGADSSGWYTFVRFTLRDGGAVLGRTREARLTRYRAGTAVTVFYDPGSPAVIDLPDPPDMHRAGSNGTTAFGGCGVLILLSVTLPFIVIGLALLLAGLSGR